MKTVHSFSPEETRACGAEVAESLAEHHASRGACVIALSGDLGAGKTTFTQGFFRGLGVRRRPMSPTFVIMRRYRVPARRGFSRIYHFDAYRLKKEDDLAVLGIKEIVADPKNIVLVEWPENIKGVLPKHTLVLDFKYGKKENERLIRLSKFGLPRGN